MHEDHCQREAASLGRALLLVIILIGITPDGNCQTSAERGDGRRQGAVDDQW